jgi:formyl-CoA transferase/CoA:oxalate CoA-transferase
MFDIIAQAMGGIMSVNGENGRAPTPVGTFMADQVGALMLAVSILGALVARERTGRGQSTNVSLLGSQIALQSFEITHYLFTNRLPRRGGRGHPHSASLWHTFPAADGYFVTAGVVEDRWADFCRLVGEPSLIDDPRFNSYEKRARHHGILVEQLDAIFRERPVAHWLSVLPTIDIACGPVKTYEDVVSDPQVLANDYITEMDHHHLGRIRVVNTPIHFNETPVRPQGPPPELGQHTEEVLLELGYDWPEIVALRDAGAI